MQELINSLQDYTLNKTNITKFTNISQSNPKNKRVNVKKSEKVVKDNMSIIPEDKDKLFWCFYILMEGEIEYNLLKANRFKIENEMKYKIAGDYKKYKHLFKPFKISKDDFHNFLINEKEIDIRVFFVLCVFNEINIIYLYKNFYFDNIIDDDKKVNVIFRNDSHNGSIHYIDSSNLYTLEYVSNNCCRMYSLIKRLKTISSFTVAELQQTAIKIGIDIKKNDKNKTKTVLYNDIITYLG